MIFDKNIPDTIKKSDDAISEVFSYSYSVLYSYHRYLPNKCSQI